jgi:hypothetical protein
MSRTAPVRIEMMENETAKLRSAHLAQELLLSEPLEVARTSSFIGGFE